MGLFARQRSSNTPTGISPHPSITVSILRNAPKKVHHYNPQKTSIVLTVQMSFSRCSKSRTGQLPWKGKQGYQGKANGCSEANFHIGYPLMPVSIPSDVLVLKQITYVTYIKMVTESARHIFEEASAICSNTVVI